MKLVRRPRRVLSWRMQSPSSTSAGHPASTSASTEHLHFIEKFCACSGLRRGDYHDVMFDRTCRPHARLLRPLLERLNPYFFAPDYDFIVDLGRTLKREDFIQVAHRFETHPLNRRFFRRLLGCRLSTKRSERIFHQTWALCERAIFIPPPDTP
jgi:hypothetical protein